MIELDECKYLMHLILFVMNICIIVHIISTTYLLTLFISCMQTTV